LERQKHPEEGQHFIEAGVDAIVASGFEEAAPRGISSEQQMIHITGSCRVPQILDNVDVP